MAATTKDVQRKHAKRRPSKTVEKRRRKRAVESSARSVALGRTLVRVVGDQVRQLGPKKAKTRQPLHPAEILARRVMAIVNRERRRLNPIFVVE